MPDLRQYAHLCQAHGPAAAESAYPRRITAASHDATSRPARISYPDVESDKQGSLISGCAYAAGISSLVWAGLAAVCLAIM